MLKTRKFKRPKISSTKLEVAPITDKFVSNKASAAILNTSIGFKTAMLKMIFSLTKCCIKSPISAMSKNASKNNQNKNEKPSAISLFLITLEIKNPKDKNTKESTQSSKL